MSSSTADHVRQYQWQQMGRTITADQEASRDQYRQNPQDRDDDRTGQTARIDEQAYQVSRVMGQESIAQLKLLLNPRATLKRYLLILNSALQDPELNGTGALQWTLSYDACGPGLTQMPADMGHIVGVRFACPFRFLQSQPSNTYANVPFPGSSWWAQSFNTKGLMTVCIEEFRAQSFIGPPYPTQGDPTINAPISPAANTQCRRFHYIGYQEWVSEVGYIIEVPAYEFNADQFGQGFYWFAYPYLPPTTLTLTFGAPFIPCQLYGTKVSGRAEKNTDDTLTIWFDQYTPMLSEPCYIRGFTTTNPVADQALIERVNTELHTDITRTGQSFPYPNDITAQPGFIFNAIDLSAVTLPADLVCLIQSTRSVMYTIGLEFYYTDF